MPRSPAQSDFAVAPEATSAAEDPEAGVAATGVERGAARWLLGLTLLMLVALVALVGVGLHIPSGG